VKNNKTLMYMKNKYCLLVFTILFSLCISCNRPNTSLKSTAEEKEMIEKTIRGCIGWAKDKNLSYLYNIIANDSDYLEVHPGPKVVKGFSEFRKAEEFWMSPDFRAVRYDVWDLKINISNSGDVAWWFCMLNDINTWKDEPASWENTRWTGVLEKRNGKWTVVQQHFSFAGE